MVAMGIQYDRHSHNSYFPAQVLTRHIVLLRLNRFFRASLHSNDPHSSTPMDVLRDKQLKMKLKRGHNNGVTSNGVIYNVIIIMSLPLQMPPMLV